MTSENSPGRLSHRLRAVWMPEFGSCGLSPALIQVLRELGFEKPTPIQAQSIPLLLAGKDLVGQSRTGSGKTAGFALPILQMLDLARRHVQALVLCPTRELCTQVAREIRKFGRRHAGLQVLILSGGQPLFPQLNSLEKGVHIAVGTPGRVLDHLLRKSLDLRHVSFLVLDEADRMLDMGFQEDIEKILRAVPESRQTVFFSATYPRSIEAMSRTYQRQPIQVRIEHTEEPSPDIRQLYYEVRPDLKVKALLWILQQNRPESALVFCNFKESVTELANALLTAGVSATCIHGGLEQRDRDRVMAKFRNRSTRVLVATDVAARGIDIENLDMVCNFELPFKAEVYVHRIGRTGRAGRRGLAISLGTTRDKGKLNMIETFSGCALERKTVAAAEQLDAEARKANLHQDAAMRTLFISGGRKEKMRPGDILGALTGEAGKLNSSDVGKIEIHDNFSYVAVSDRVSEVTLERLRNGRIKGRKFRIELVR